MEFFPLPEIIALLPLNAAMLLVVFGFFLGFATGRVTVPVSIIFPIFMAQNSLNAVPFLAFGVMYFSTFLGYVVSPVHPCVSISLQYFKAEFNSYGRTLLLPVLIGLSVSFALLLFAG